MNAVMWLFLETLSAAQLLTRKEMSTFTSAIKLDLEVIDLVKEQCTMDRPEYVFRKTHVIKLIKSLTNFIYQNVSPM